MNADIIQNIFRLLLQVLHESREPRPGDATLESFWSNADEWVDCWVSCAAIVVYNGLRVSGFLTLFGDLADVSYLRIGTTIWKLAPNRGEASAILSFGAAWLYDRRAPCE